MSTKKSHGLFLKVSKKYTFWLLLLVVIFCSQEVEAQCSMCRAALESEADNSTAEGINNGIVYLMALPYILIAGVFYFVYRKMKN